MKQFQETEVFYPVETKKRFRFKQKRPPNLKISTNSEENSDNTIGIFHCTESMPTSPNIPNPDDDDTKVCFLALFSSNFEQFLTNVQPTLDKISTNFWSISSV